MAWEDPIPAWNPEWYGFTDRGMQWLADHGCEWVKVCAEPGDLLLWDSRTPHYNLSSETTMPRFCIYTCYMPVKDATQDELRRKKDAFESMFPPFLLHFKKRSQTDGVVLRRLARNDALAQLPGSRHERGKARWQGRPPY